MSEKITTQTCTPEPISACTNYVYFTSSGYYFFELNTDSGTIRDIEIFGTPNFNGIDLSTAAMIMTSNTPSITDISRLQQFFYSTDDINPGWLDISTGQTLTISTVIGKYVIVKYVKKDSSVVAMPLPARLKYSGYSNSLGGGWPNNTT
jgi:hypothetical protein